MNFHVLTLFPEMIMNGLETSILGRAAAKGIVSFEAVNIRDYTLERHGKVDDYPYGGGAGMVMQAEPIYRAYEALVEKIGKKPRVIYMTPQGKTFNQNIAEDLAKEEDLVFLCGHYEGVDERVLEMIATDYLSAGDYVLTGGELPAMMMIDCISRLVPGVLNNNVSAEFESPVRQNPLQETFWSIRSTRARKCSWAKKCRISFFPGIMQMSRNGAGSSRSSAH